MFGRPQIPRWLGVGVPMSGELARRIFLFRVHAAETLRDGDAAFHAWLAGDFHLGGSAIEALSRYMLEQESVSEIPTLSALSIEGIAMQACMEYFVHTPLPRSANETIARVLVQRWGSENANTMALAADLGIYLLIYGEEPITPNEWRTRLNPAHFAADFHEHLHGSDLLAQQFARVAQTGLMVMRNPLGRKRKVGGKDWAQHRLYERLRERAPDFVLLRQAEREAAASTCDLQTARAFVEQLAALPIRLRYLPEPSPFGESLLHGGFPRNSPTLASLAGASG